MKVISRGWPREDFEERIQPVIEQMMSERGWIMNSYAQIEFLAADLIIKCRKFDEYKELCDQFPESLKKRVQIIDQLCSFGPMKKYASSLPALFEKFVTMSNARNFFAHGFLSVHISTDGKDLGMHFRRFVPPRGKDKRESRQEMFIRPSDMSRAHYQWNVFAQTAVEIIRDVYKDLDLEADDVTNGSPSLI